jgi:hypothetical protein
MIYMVYSDLMGFLDFLKFFAFQARNFIGKSQLS